METKNYTIIGLSLALLIRNEKIDNEK